MKTLEQMLNELPPSRRKRVERRAALLIEQEMTMRELRKARQLTQGEMAKTLGVKQEQISRLEKRTDLHLSTLRRQVQALGGELDLVVSFPDAAPIRLGGFAEIPDGKPVPLRPRKQADRLRQPAPAHTATRRPRSA